MLCDLKTKGTKVMHLLYIFYISFICFSCGDTNPACGDTIHAANERTTEIATSTTEPIPAATHVDRYLSLLAGKRVACVVNHSSLVYRTHLVDTLRSRGIVVQKVFAPEHGFRGGADAGTHIADGRDPESGVTILSLYGDKKKPAGRDLQDVDVILFDIQDVGVRFYTYISTLHYVMEACAENHLPLIVLDRPNPNGFYVDGPLLAPPYRSFVGMHPIPVVYGMTIGELAQMINGEGWLEDGLRCDLVVVSCTDYDHTMTYTLPVAPSPNLPNLRSILLYPSICFFEGTHVSVGRGTDRQFQVLGHPEFPVRDFSFVPVSMPGAAQPPHKGTRVYGSDLTVYAVEDILTWRALNLQWLIDYHKALAPSGKFYLNTGFFEKLAGTDTLRKQLDAGWTEEEIRASWQSDLSSFMQTRKKYLLYPDFD